MNLEDHKLILHEAIKLLPEQEKNINYYVCTVWDNGEVSLQGFLKYNMDLKGYQVNDTTGYQEKTIGRITIVLT